MDMWWDTGSSLHVLDEDIDQATVIVSYNGT